ncbi:MAG: hypothetical protein R2764_12515 [Bacteroidales bacterium]
MKLTPGFIFIFISITLQLEAQYFSGYDSEIKGETIRYECQQPDADSALLVRSLKEDKYIEWTAAKIPEDFDDDYAEFIWIAGIDVNPEDNHEFKMYINDELNFTFRNPLDTLKRNLDLDGMNGIKLHFKGIMFDKYGDLFGYMFLKIPKAIYKKERSIKIKVAGETANSRSWFMIFKYQALPGVKFIEEQAISIINGTEYQHVRIDILHFDNPGIVTIKLGNIKQDHPLDLGFNLFRMQVPRVTESTKLEATVRLNDKILVEDSITIYPVKEMTLYLLPHSHNDIGYTHIQSEVEQIQWQNLRDAIKYAQQTSGYPDGSQFKWSVEVMWAVDTYLRNAGEKEKKDFIEAAQKGWLELNGFYANILTGLCRPEELYRMMKSAADAGEMCGVEVNSAMITDIPGYTWGIIPVMAQSGVEYFSIGTNTFHRIGNIIEAWGDKPFYWQSPSGEEKVLCWVHGKGYSDFHTGLAYTKLRNKLKEQLIFDYLKELQDQNYPYDIVTMRYNIGSDNGPPDPFLADIVKAWNTTYTSPKIIISTVSESFSIFEQKYSHILPIERGDLTGYWEDGASSSAKETAINRASAERLTQAETLYSLMDPSNYPEDRFNEAWDNVLLYSEHTWGSWNSISEPHSDFTMQQWNIKKSFAEAADKQSKQLLEDALKMDMAETVSQIDIYNSSSWDRTDLVSVPESYYLRGELVKDEDGNIIQSQRLSSGELVFIAEDVPALSAKRYFFDRKEKTTETEQKTDFSEDNPFVKFDQETGAIQSLEFQEMQFNFVSGEHDFGLNSYFYIEGRMPGNPKTNGKPAIRIKENGPVVKLYSVESDAPGCHSMIREIRIIERLDRVEIINTIDKKENLEPEGVHFAFPFNVRMGEVRISNAWGFYIPEKEQLPGSNKNFFSVNRWVDISNENYGITWVTLDAPLIELGEITMDEIDYGWVREVPQTQTLYSYVMNNYWETNYKAGQEGETSFRYALYPHREFDAIQAEKWGIEQHQPLIPVAATRSKPILKPEFNLVSQSTYITSMKPIKDHGILIRLYNPSYQDDMVHFEWLDNSLKIYESDPWGSKLELMENEIEMPPFGLQTIVVK